MSDGLRSGGAESSDLTVHWGENVAQRPDIRIQTVQGVVVRVLGFWRAEICTGGLERLIIRAQLVEQRRAGLRGAQGRLGALLELGHRFSVAGEAAFLTAVSVRSWCNAVGRVVLACPRRRVRLLSSRRTRPTR